jgi:putative transposase
VRETIRRWQTGGLGGLWEAEGRGRHRRWREEDWQALAQWTQEPRRYSAAQLAAKLAAERQVHLGQEQVRRILKKNYTWKRIRQSPPTNTPTKHYQAKRSDWEMLKAWAQLGVICLKYLDESGSCIQRSSDYAYSLCGPQKRVKQRKRRGRRINILGIWQPQVKFDDALMVGSLKTATFLKLMDWQASKAQQQLEQTGQLTVIVLDNASVHRSKLSQQQQQRWQQQGLLLFFLPPYSPQMNRNENESLHLKRNELASRVFDDEVDLADAIMEGIENRGRNGQHSVERFKFN